MMSSTTQSRRSGSVSPPAVEILSALAWVVGLALLLVVAGGWLHGKSGVEKTLTYLIMPVGAGWLLLSGWTLQCLSQVLRRRRTPLQLLPPLLLWGLFTLASTPLIGDAGFKYLETREDIYDPASDPPLDLLVVLGGGTEPGPYRAEASESGDRVLLAAQLFLQGRAKRLITTGSLFSGEPNSVTTPAEQTQEIWMQLGIPHSAIETLPGTNTFAEMQGLKQRLQAEAAARADVTEPPSRVGLLTSAWHLPRAMRLARAAGLEELTPVAADHEQRAATSPFWEYLPSARNLVRLERCQREFLAGLVNR